MKPPPGYRFLIQLVDDQPLADAQAELRAMFGQECVEQAIFVKGCWRYRRDKPYYGRVEHGYGWTVFVKQSFKL